jgi:hypothetical protein
MTLNLVSNFHHETWDLPLLRSPKEVLLQLQKDGSGEDSICNTGDRRRKVVSITLRSLYFWENSVNIVGFGVGQDGHGKS